MHALEREKLTCTIAGKKRFCSCIPLLIALLPPFVSSRGVGRFILILLLDGPGVEGDDIGVDRYLAKDREVPGKSMAHKIRWVHLCVTK